MLDQNTDRMWYVIGAVIIGAAIILIMNKTFPQLFASVGETFKSKTEQTTDVVDGIGPLAAKDYLGPDDLTTSYSEILAYDAKTSIFDMRIQSTTAWQSDGFFVKAGQIVVPYGQTFTLTYAIYIPEGIDDLVAEVDVNNHSVRGTAYDWYGNDNDNRESRRFNGVLNYKSPISLTAGEWNTITVSYTNTDVLNTAKDGLYDSTRFGVTNHTGQSIDVKIKNIRVVVQ